LVRDCTRSGNGVMEDVIQIHQIYAIVIPFFEESLGVHNYLGRLRK